MTMDEPVYKNPAIEVARRKQLSDLSLIIQARFDLLKSHNKSLLDAAQSGNQELVLQVMKSIGQLNVELNTLTQEQYDLVKKLYPDSKL